MRRIVPASMSAPTDRRRHVRAPVSLMGTVQGDDGEHPIVVLDLSASGAMIQAQEAPVPDAIYTLRFSVDKKPYELRFQVLQSVHKGDCWGWRGPFSDVSPAHMQDIDRAVHAAAGLRGADLRPWDEIAAEAEAQPDAKVLIGSTPAGHEIRVPGKDALEMGRDGLDLYARLMCDLETI